MVTNSKTGLPEQSNKPKIKSNLQSQQNECPIAREISHQLQLPNFRQGDLGTLYLPRDDFCPESAYCVFCSFVARLRPAGIKGTSPNSVDFVTGDRTIAERLRGWINPQSTIETPSLSGQDTSGLIIHVTSGVSEFQTVDWRVERTYFNPPKDGPDRDIIGTFHLWKYEAPDCYLPTPTVDTLTYITKYAK